MNLTLDLRPDIERNLLVQAEARGLSLSDFAKEVLTQQATSPALQHRQEACPPAIRRRISTNSLPRSEGFSPMKRSISTFPALALRAALLI